MIVSRRHLTTLYIGVANQPSVQSPLTCSTAECCKLRGRTLSNMVQQKFHDAYHIIIWNGFTWAIGLVATTLRLPSSLSCTPASMWIWHVKWKIFVPSCSMITLGVKFIWQHRKVDFALISFYWGRTPLLLSLTKGQISKYRQFKKIVAAHAI